jgi:hypothetical protein
MHFLIVAGFVFGVWWLFCMVLGLTISAVGLLVLVVLRMIFLIFRVILKFLFPWAFRPVVRKEPVGFYLPSSPRRRHGFFRLLYP